MAALAGGLAGWYVRGAPTRNVVVLLNRPGTPDSFALEIDRPGTYEAEWSNPPSQSDVAVVVPARLLCIATFKGQLVQTVPTAILVLTVRAVRQPVVVGLTLMESSGSPRSTFLFETANGYSTSTGTPFFDQNGFTIKPRGGC